MRGSCGESLGTRPHPLRGHEGASSRPQGLTGQRRERLHPPAGSGPECWRAAGPVLEHRTPCAIRVRAAPSPWSRASLRAVLKEVRSRSLGTGLRFVLGWEFQSTNQRDPFSPLPKHLPPGICGLCPPLRATASTCSLRDWPGGQCWACASW